MTPRAALAVLALVLTNGAQLLWVVGPLQAARDEAAAELSVADRALLAYGEAIDELTAQLQACRGGKGGAAGLLAGQG